MPTWLERALSQLSPEGAGLTMLGAVVTTVVASILRARHIVAKEQRAMQAVPPTPAPSVTIETLQERIDQLQTRLRREQWRITEYERQATELGRDHAATAASLAAERAKSEHLERLLQHNRETPTKPIVIVPREAITVRPDRPASTQIIEIEDHPTPRHGRRFIRPPGD